MSLPRQNFWKLGIGMRNEAKLRKSFATEVAWGVREICNSPERWKRYDYGTRRFMLPNFPFSIVYRVHQNAVQVVAVAHHRRRPGYWHGR